MHHGLFWKLAISYARTKGIRLDTLVELARADQKRRIMPEGKTESLLTTMIRCLFPNLGTPDSFRTELARTRRGARVRGRGNNR